MLKHAFNFVKKNQAENTKPAWFSNKI